MPTITRWSSNGRQHHLEGMFSNSSSSKAAAFLTRGAYILYVSTAKGRERRWRLFSTFPFRYFPETANEAHVRYHFLELSIVL